MKKTTILTCNGMTLTKSNLNSRASQFVNFMVDECKAGRRVTRRTFFDWGYVSPRTGHSINYRPGFGTTVFTALKNANVIVWNKSLRSYVAGKNIKQFYRMLLANANQTAMVEGFNEAVSQARYSR